MREIEDREWSEWRETGRHKRIAADGGKGSCFVAVAEEKGKSKRKEKEKEENEVSDDVPQL